MKIQKWIRKSLSCMVVFSLTTHVDYFGDFEICVWQDSIPNQLQHNWWWWNLGIHIFYRPPLMQFWYVARFGVSSFMRIIDINNIWNLALWGMFSITEVLYSVAQRKISLSSWGMAVIPRDDFTKMKSFTQQTKL